MIPDIFSLIILIFVAPGKLIQYEGGLERPSKGMARACLYPRIAFYFDSYLLLLNKTPIAKKSDSTIKKEEVNDSPFFKTENFDFSP